MTPPIAHQDDYIIDVPYPDYFHRELMPLWLCSTLQALGRRAPDLLQPYTWLELGCGTGISTVIAAVTNPMGNFIGIDINPNAISRAQALADTVGVRNVRFLCQSFETTLSTRGTDALPGCDFIVSHGVYSWVSPTQRSALRALVDRHLKPGGVLYLAYMSQPGSAAMAAAQKLAYLSVENFTVQGTPASSEIKADAGIALLEALSTVGTGYFTEHPRLASEVGKLSAMDRRYIAHEFLNAHWDSLHVADVIADLQDVGCSYAGSATLLENVDGASLPENCLPVLAQLRARGVSLAAQETFKDIARNQNERRDIYQRDASAPDTNLLSAEEHRGILLAQRVALLPAAPNEHASLPPVLMLETRIGPVQIPMAHVAPLLTSLQAGPKSYAQLIQLPPYVKQPGSVSQLLQILAWVGWIHFLRPDWEIGGTNKQLIQKINIALENRLCGYPPLRYTAAAATGSAQIMSSNRNNQIHQKIVNFLNS